MKSAESFTLAIVNLVIVAIVCAICLLNFPRKFIKKPITKWSILNRYEAVITILSFISNISQLIEISVHVRKLVVNNPEIATDWRSPDKISHPVAKWVVSPTLAIVAVTIVLLAGFKYRSIRIPSSASKEYLQTRWINIICIVMTLCGIWMVVSTSLTDIVPEESIRISRVCSAVCLSCLLLIFTATIEMMIFFTIFRRFHATHYRNAGSETIIRFKPMMKSVLTHVEWIAAWYLIILIFLGTLAIVFYLVPKFDNNKLWHNYYSSMSNAVGLCVLYHIPSLLSKFHSAFKRSHREAMTKQTSNVTELSTVQSLYAQQGHLTTMDPSFIETESHIFDDDSEDEEEGSSKLFVFMRATKFQS